MTKETKELYSYITGVEPFCFEISKLQKNRDNFSYEYAKKLLENIISKAVREYTEEFPSVKYCFTEINCDAVMYRILSEMYDRDTSAVRKIRKYLDEIYEESTILPDNFGNTILRELETRFIEDGYKITKQNVLQEMLWCYMSRMQ